MEEIEGLRGNSKTPSFYLQLQTVLVSQWLYS